MATILKKFARSGNDREPLFKHDSHAAFFSMHLIIMQALGVSGIRAYTYRVFGLQIVKPHTQMSTCQPPITSYDRITTANHDRRLASASSVLQLCSLTFTGDSLSECLFANNSVHLSRYRHSQNNHNEFTKLLSSACN